LYAGPCWDYDLSSGNIGPYYSGEYKDGVTYNSYKATDMVWYRYLMNNEEFKSIVIKYYYQYLPEIKALFDGTKADEGYGIDGILNQYESSFIRNYTSSDKNGAGWNVMTPDQADAYSNANLFDDEQTEDTTKTGRWATYEEAVEYLRDWLLNRDKWLESEWDINSVSVISTDLAITGFQVSTVLGENNDEVGIRTVYQHEPTVEGQEVVEFGLIYGLDGLGLTDGDMTYNNDATYDNGVVKTITNAATSAGLCQVQMGQSDTALYYVRTMPVSGGLNANYKVRPYAILQDGTIAYGLIDSYNVFKVAKTLYEGGQMPTQTAHQALYDKIIAPVIAEDDTQTITETDYNWNKTLVKNDIAVAENALNIEGYQMTSSLGGVEGKMGLRVVYSVEGEFSEIGLIYGLALGENGATVDDMTLENAADTTNKYVVSYKTTEENGNLHTQMGASDTAQYYARTMNVSGQSKSAYTATYMVRVYGKDAEGNITYSDVKSYSVIDVAEQLYDNDLMSTVAGHDALYTNILTKVDSEYKKVDYDYQNTMTK
jgi:hypothetical protein